MANLYNYGSPYGGSSAYSARLRATDDGYSDASFIGSARYLSSDQGAIKYYDRGSSLYSSHAEGLRLSSVDIPGVGASGTFPAGKIAGGLGASAAPWAGVDAFIAAPAFDPEVVSVKRPAEALYHQSILGSQNAIGQSEALLSTNSLAKRPRLESAITLHNYPLRPGEKDCPYYMRTRTCKFGANCKFDHPLWVPEGGIPDWKEIPVIHGDETLPERPGEPDCPYYLKTQRCKFGSRCKFNHPKDKTEAITSVGQEDARLPSVGSNQQMELAVQDNGAPGGDSNQAKTFVPFTPALLHNSKGLPIRPGETDCPFYLKTGSCKYGVACRYNHPDLNSINPLVADALGQAVILPPPTNLPIGVLNPATSLLPNIDPLLAQASIAVGPAIYPQRPGELECDFYMKTGQCKFAERCKFHHPIDRTVPTLEEQNVKLTLAGLPRREGTVQCSYYMKTGSCNYGAKCRYDHPPPGEAIAMVQSQGNIAVAVTTTGEN